MLELQGDIVDIYAHDPCAVCCVPVNGNAVLSEWAAFPQLEQLWTEFLRKNRSHVHLFAYRLVAFPVDDVQRSLVELVELVGVFGWARVFLPCSDGLDWAACAHYEDWLVCVTNDKEIVL